LIGGMSKTCRREQSTSSAPGEVGSAATATGGFVADHDVRVGHLLQGSAHGVLAVRRASASRAAAAIEARARWDRPTREAWTNSANSSATVPPNQLPALSAPNSPLAGNQARRAFQRSAPPIRCRSAASFLNYRISTSPLFGNTPNTTLHVALGNPVSIQSGISMTSRTPTCGQG
jgi:hypothetical protein